MGVRFSAVHDDWDDGFEQKSLINDDQHCRSAQPTLHWNSVLPYRWMNFFTGPTTCGNRPDFAKLEDGLLTVDCDAGAVVIELPETGNWDFSLKSPVTFQLNNLRDNILNHTRTYTYSEPVYIKSLAVLVRCEGEEQVLVQSVRDEEIVNARKALRKDKTDADQLSVLYINIDAFSRAHFNRRWPKTIQFLEDMNQQKSDGEVFQLFRYHSVGRNTIPNDQAMYLGINEEDPVISNHSLQRDPIWEDFGASGRVTAVMDNSCLDWSVKYQYRRTSVSVFQFVAPFCLPKLHPLINPYGPLDGPFSIRRRCLNGRYSHDIALDWLSQFVEDYKDVPFFGVAAFNEAHEGTGEVIGLMDDDFAEFLERVNFNKTVVFLISDHGLHMSPYFALNTYSARAENMLPMGNIVVPRWFLDNHPSVREALIENQQNLVTAYDFYVTMRSLINFGEKFEHPWGLNIFDKIDTHRNCTAANIPSSLCYCK